MFNFMELLAHKVHYPGQAYLSFAALSGGFPFRTGLNTEKGKSLMVETRKKRCKKTSDFLYPDIQLVQLKQFCEKKRGRHYWPGAEAEAKRQEDRHLN